MNKASRPEAVDLMVDGGVQPTVWEGAQLASSGKELPTLLKVTTLVLAASAAFLVLDGGPGVPAPRVGSHSSAQNFVPEPRKGPNLPPSKRPSFSSTHH